MQASLWGILRLCLLLLGVGFAVPQASSLAEPACETLSGKICLDQGLISHHDAHSCEIESGHCHCWSDVVPLPSRSSAPEWNLAVWNPSETGIGPAGLPRPGPVVGTARTHDWLEAPAPHSLGVGLRLYA